MVLAQEPALLFWCDELAVHSCPLSTPSRADSNAAKLASALFYCCVTITWRRIFKGFLQVTIVNAFSACDSCPQTSLAGDAAIQ